MTSPDPIGTYLAGPDRIEFHPILQRPIRMGSPQELSVSDSDRIRIALEAGDVAQAAAYSGLVNAILSAITNTFFEWCLALPHVLARTAGEKHAGHVTPLALDSWRRGLEHNGAGLDERAADKLKTLYERSALNHDEVIHYRKSAGLADQHPGWQILAEPAERFAAFTQALNAGKFSGLYAEFERYRWEMRSYHDLCAQYVAIYISNIVESLTQGEAARIGQEALESCTLLQDMWSTIAKLDPASLTLFLAEHLRGHFSGSDRKCSVEILEDDVCYRLRFAPCGTGGVLRQRNTQGHANFTSAAPETWGRSGEVPAYCSHCALNETTSLARLGYLAWVTEFDPNPAAPCGWTVYKNQKAVPDLYLRRIGARAN